MMDDKLALNVFKTGGEPHIQIQPGKERDARLKVMVGLCPAGVYREGENGTVTLVLDGCLECGTCRVICGDDLLHWQYPAGGLGVQYRYG